MISYEEKRAIVDQFHDALPSEAPKDGILCVDKPTGPTSFDIVAAVKRRYSQKVGHTGTLDPLASGLLILLVGKATKRAKEFEGLDKTYEVEGVFGEERDSFDAEGKITAITPSERVKSLKRSEIDAALLKFQGKQEQRVPVFSAVRVDGKRLYESAHAGKEIKTEDLPVRMIEIFKIEVLDFIAAVKATGGLPRFRLRIHCSKGTYVRSIVHDLGLALDGHAYVNELRRVSVGSYTV